MTTLRASIMMMVSLNIKIMIINWMIDELKSHPFLVHFSV